jgi:hypothetical protein
MKTLVTKMSKLGLLKVEIIFYAVLMIALALVLPISIIVLDVTLFADPVVLGIVLIYVLFWGLMAYILCIRRYVLYRKLPQVLVEADGEFLYIHAKKEGKIPLSSLSDVIVDVDVPYLFQPGFLREIIVHAFSYKYGTIILDIPDYGTYKMPFVANAQEVAEELVSFIDDLASNR